MKDDNKKAKALAAAMGPRIKQARVNRQKTQEDVSQDTGYSIMSITRYETGKRPPDGVFLHEFCYHYDVNPKWLLFGTGNWELKKAAEAEPAAKFPVFKPAGTAEARLCEDTPIDFIEVPINLQSESVTIIKYMADNMLPSIHYGAFVGIDCLEKTLRSGHVYAIWTPVEGTTLRRVYFSTTRVALRSDNQNYPDLEITPQEVPELILGKMVWVFQQC